MQLFKKGHVSIIRKKEKQKMKEALIFLVIMMFAIPFGFMIVADIIDVANRIASYFRQTLKPAAIIIMKSLID
jgi:hypothetical protein